MYQPSNDALQKSIKHLEAQYSEKIIDSWTNRNITKYIKTLIVYVLNNKEIDDKLSKAYFMTRYAEIGVNQCYLTIVLLEIDRLYSLVLHDQVFPTDSGKSKY